MIKRKLYFYRLLLSMLCKQANPKQQSVHNDWLEGNEERNVEYLNFISAYFLLCKIHICILLEQYLVILAYRSK